MAVKYVNVSNPTAFGVEWVAGETGNRYQLVNIRGTSGLLFGTRLAGSDHWMQTPVIAPERFGLDKPLKSFDEFMKIVRAYVEE